LHTPGEKENTLVERNLLQVDVQRHVRTVRSAVASFTNIKKDESAADKVSMILVIHHKT
jgi:hypothetical protein